jgi:hypothetical protein
MAENNDFAMGYALGQDSGGNSNNDGGFGFGGGWGGLLGLIVVASLFGWGGMGGFGGFGGFGGGAGLQGMATRADINEGFAFNNLQGSVQAIQQGLCDGFYGIANSFSNLSHDLSSCCCTTQKAIDGVNYNISTQFANLANTMCGNTRDIIDSQNAGTRAILDFLVQEKLSAKDARIAQLENSVALANQSAVFSAKIDSATAELLRRTGHDCPVGAYLVQPPTPINFATNGCGTVQFGAYGYNNGGCACANGYTQ